LREAGFIPVTSSPPHSTHLSRPWPRQPRPRIGDHWVQHYTPDVDYIEHAAGTMKGRDEVLTWIRNTMTTFPGSHMTAFPSLVVGDRRGRRTDNLRARQSDWSTRATGRSSARPTSRSSRTRGERPNGADKKTSTTRCGFCRRESSGAKKAEALGTLDDDAARWLQTYGGDLWRVTVSAPKLVIGANGFLGSHVTRQLIAAGADVRAMVRPTANTRSIDDLDVTRFHGDVSSIRTPCARRWRAATRSTTASSIPGPGCKTRHRCFHTNVEGLRSVLDVACGSTDFVHAEAVRVHQHVCDGGSSSWPRSHRGRPDRPPQPHPLRRVAGPGRGSGAAVRGRSRAARHRHVRFDDLWRRRLGAAPRTAHSSRGAVFGKLPFSMNGIQLEVVGVDDAAQAMLLAAERGRDGERYLISERMIPLKEVVEIAADEAGRAPRHGDRSRCRWLYGLAAMGTLRARLTGKDAELSMKSVRMMRAEAPVDHSKATRELGWEPRPVEESIREAARFWASMKNAKRNSKAASSE